MDEDEILGSIEGERLFFRIMTPIAADERVKTAK